MSKSYNKVMNSGATRVPGSLTCAVTGINTAELVLNATQTCLLDNSYSLESH